MQPNLESIVGHINYGELPETWRVPRVERFSLQKTLYDYQRSAMENAARALYCYYEQQRDWSPSESQDTNYRRKLGFSHLYGSTNIQDIKKYEKRNDKANDTQSPVFRILADYIKPEKDCINYANLINRMCFWMATGSGKTLVMVKLIEYLHFLQRHGEIPSHNMLILAPSEHLIGQIRRTIDEFNQTGGLQIDLVPLRQASKGAYQHRIGESVTVYYHRSDNISDVQKDALTDYRTYENDGKWFILLDEAHKGGKENSKRQAYYAVMAREGFLFNFSATFTDNEDIITTVKKYNLEEFVSNGHGKNIYLNETEYSAFQTRQQEISDTEKRKIVLKSLITLGFISNRVGELREQTGLEKLYHQPLMLTLVNSVNTDIENGKNDLWAFFQTLREIATGEIDEALFKAAKTELSNDWKNAKLLFSKEDERSMTAHADSITSMTVASLRKAVFLNERKGALQFIRSSDNKELAFQMRNADAPFALIRIGDTSKWRNTLLVGYEETSALQEKSFFNGLEKSSITILMGSRSFFESWDSNRPNVINFINIGGKDAKKFVVQSVGRGVRIETLPNQRRRFDSLPDSTEKKIVQQYHDKVQPPETLFLFATNRSAVKTVLDGLESEKGSTFHELTDFERAPPPKIGAGNKDMPLLVPEYKETAGRGITRAQFTMSEETLNRLKGWLDKTSDSVLAVRDGLAADEITDLRALVEAEGGIKVNTQKNYAMISFLQDRLLSHLAQTVRMSDGIRKLDDEDIVHFRQIRVHTEHARALQTIINQVKQGRFSDEDMTDLVDQLRRKEINRTEFNQKVAGQEEVDYNELTIKRLEGHYYFPVVLGDQQSNYMQHIIKVPSEVEFLNTLEKWIEANSVQWDAWMFSKIDESADQIDIPYFDGQANEYRRFLPDFVFWMCRDSEYRIVFVDPKGTEHASAYRKIDGYKGMFENDGKVIEFKHGNKWKVSVHLLMYGSNTSALEAYRQYWSDSPEAIFQAA